jgi:hypothetical protein
MSGWDAASALPEPARAKFRRLAGLAQDRRAATNRAYEVVEEARERLGKARIALAIAQRLPATTTDVIEGRRQLQDDITACETEVARLVAEREARAGKSGGTVALVNRIENYIGDLPARATVEPFTGPLPSRKSSEAPTAVIARCRAEIEKLKARIGEVQAAPRPANEVMERLLAEIDTLAERGEPDIEPLFEGSGGIEWPSIPVDILARSIDGAPITAHGSSFDALGFLAWLFKPALVKAVTAAAERAHGDDGNAIPTAQRPKMLGQLRASLLELERVEEAAADELEAAGAAVERRADADPRAVLGLSSSLPAPSRDEF